MLPGKKLQFIRIYKGISQTEVATKLKVSKSYISMLENEKQDIPEYFYEKWVDVLNGKEIIDEDFNNIENESESITNEVKEAAKQIKRNKKKSK